MAESALKLLTPNTVDVRDVGHNVAKISIEPLERGFGHTLGNALRRVLLSSMTGAAVVEVEIDGVLHEYTTIEGVQEDVTEILLNIKQLAIKNASDQESTLSLHAKGSGPVTARDIKGDHNIEIVNPDQVIAHLTSEGELNINMRVAVGRGYQPAAARVEAEDGDRHRTHQSHHTPRHLVEENFVGGGRTYFVPKTPKLGVRVNNFCAIHVGI